MSVKFFVVLSLLLIPLLSQGSVLTSEPGEKKIESVAIAKSATLNIENQTRKLDFIAAGLRQKKVLFVQVKVYIAELFASDGSKFIHSQSEALNSLELSPTIAMRLHFLRNVDAEKIQTSFREALVANGVALDSPAIQTFLAAASAGGAVDNGNSLTIVTQKNPDNSETVTFENAKGEIKLIKSNTGLSKQILSIWLGTPADDGIAKLKEELVKATP